MSFCRGVWVLASNARNFFVWWIKRSCHRHEIMMKTEHVFRKLYVPIFAYKMLERRCHSLCCAVWLGMVRKSQSVANTMCVGTYDGQSLSIYFFNKFVSLSLHCRICCNIGTTEWCTSRKLSIDVISISSTSFGSRLRVSAKCMCSPVIVVTSKPNERITWAHRCSRAEIPITHNSWVTLIILLKSDTICARPFSWKYRHWRTSIHEKSNRSIVDLQNIYTPLGQNIYDWLTN